MNKVELTGRATSDPHISYGGKDNQTCIAKFNLAVDRNTSNKGTDFPTIKVLGQRAQWVEKYVHKGMKLEVVGALRTGSYDKDGRTEYYTEVLADEVNFGESKKESESRENAAGLGSDVIGSPAGNDGFTQMAELPFAMD